MIISFIISIVVTLIIFFVSGSGASFLMSFIILLVGSIVVITTNEKKNRIYGLTLFYIILSIYSLLALFHYLDICSDYDYFLGNAKDELYFFNMSESYKYTSIHQIFKNCLIDKVHLESSGYIFYIGSLASIATSYFDGNHLLLQFLGSTFFGSLASIILFNFLILHIAPKRAFHYTLTFMIFSVFNYYSIVLLRDIHISFLYLLGFVIISKKFSIKGLIGLVILNVIIWQFRNEHGLAFIFFILYYFYLTTKNRKILFIALIFILVLMSSTFIIKNYEGLEKTLTGYSNFTEQEVLSNDDSFGKAIWKLPSPLRQIVTLIFSQMQPFPSWTKLDKSRNTYNFIVSFLPVLYSFFWFIIFFCTMKWTIIEKRIKRLDSRIVLLAFVALMFLVGNIANMNIRRIMVVYPIFYLIYTLLKEKHVDKHNARITINYAIFTYFSLTAIYITMKAVL